MNEPERKQPFPSSGHDLAAADICPDTPQTNAPAYRLAFADQDFLLREDLRPVRMQLELLKPQLIMDERGIESTVVLFGGARIPSPERAASAKTPILAEMSRYYTEAQTFARKVTERSLKTYGRHWVIVTGGGPGVMEAGNRGAAEAGGQSIGLNIVLPHEQSPNPFVTPDLCFNFHYFALRKMHFLVKAAAITVFPGGFGTLDEMFEALTLIQTTKMKAIPFILFGREWWSKVVNWEMLAEAGVISEQDLQLFHIVDTAAEALEILDSWKPLS